MKNNNKDKILLIICFLTFLIMASYFFSKMTDENSMEILQNGSSLSLIGYYMLIVIIFGFISTIVMALFLYKISNNHKERRDFIKSTGKKMNLEYVDIMICNKKRINLSATPLIYYWIFKDENNNYILMDQYTQKYNVSVKGHYLIPNYTKVDVRDRNYNIIPPGTKMDVYLIETPEDNRCIFFQGGSPEENTLEINKTIYYENNLVERPIGTYKCRFNHSNVNFESLNNAKYCEGIIEYSKIDKKI